MVHRSTPRLNIYIYLFFISPFFTVMEDIEWMMTASRGYTSSLRELTIRRLKTVEVDIWRVVRCSSILSYPCLARSSHQWCQIGLDRNYSRWLIIIVSLRTTNCLLPAERSYLFYRFFVFGIQQTANSPGTKKYFTPGSQCQPVVPVQCFIFEILWDFITWHLLIGKF